MPGRQMAELGINAAQAVLSEQLQHPTQPPITQRQWSVDAVCFALHIVQQRSQQIELGF